MARASLRDTVIGWAKALFPPKASSLDRGPQREHRLQWPRSGAVNFSDFRRYPD